MIADASRFRVFIKSSASVSAPEIMSAASASAASIYFLPRLSAADKVDFAFASALSSAAVALFRLSLRIR